MSIGSLSIMVEASSRRLISDRLGFVDRRPLLLRRSIPAMETIKAGQRMGRLQGSYRGHVRVLLADVGVLTAYSHGNPLCRTN